MNTSPRMVHLLNVAALKRLGVIDGPTRAALDAMAAISARTFGVPTVLISLIDVNRQWFLSRVGFEGDSAPIEDTICQYTIRRSEPLVVLDASKREDLRDSPYVSAEGGVRFYAGAPLLSSDGLVIGTLCLVDPSPRSAFGTGDVATLERMGLVVSALLEGGAARAGTSIAAEGGITPARSAPERPRRAG